MCFFAQAVWACGYWRWGQFREKCYKEYRMGETCGLKLVYEINYKTTCCCHCTSIATKKRRMAKMSADVARWRQQRIYPATIEKTELQMIALQQVIFRITKQHDAEIRRLRSDFCVPLEPCVSELPNDWPSKTQAIGVRNRHMAIDGTHDKPAHMVNSEIMVLLRPRRLNAGGESGYGNLHFESRPTCPACSFPTMCAHQMPSVGCSP